MTVLVASCALQVALESSFGAREFSLRQCWRHLWNMLMLNRIQPDLLLETRGSIEEHMQVTPKCAWTGGLQTCCFSKRCEPEMLSLSVLVLVSVSSNEAWPLQMLAVVA